MRSNQRVKRGGRRKERWGRWGFLSLAAHCAMGGQVDADTCPLMLSALLSLLSYSQLRYCSWKAQTILSFPSPFLEPEGQATMSCGCWVHGVIYSSNQSHSSESFLLHCKGDWGSGALAEIYQLWLSHQSPDCATVWLEKRGQAVGLGGQGILTGGEVISGGVDMSPKSSNWVTAWKDKRESCKLLGLL